MRATATRAPAAELPRAARGAVTALFFINGAVFANWVPRIPEVKAALGLGEGALGAALLGVGLGGLIGSLGAGPLVARIGSRNASVAGAVVLGAVLFLPGVSGSWLALAASMVLVGLADSAMDVAMNAHAVVVQRGYPRPILNAFHGWWGLGAAVGASVGSLAAGAGIGVAPHLALTGLAGGIAGLAVRPRLLPSTSDRLVGDGPRFVRPGRLVVLLGLLTMLAAFIEDTPASWSAVYLTEDLDVPRAAAGAGFVASTAALTAGRLVADRLVARLGTVTVSRIGLLLAGGGLAVGLLIGGVPATIFGFGMVGLGVGPFFPASLGAAGALPGYPPGSAIAVVSLIARFGFLFGPPLIGVLAEQIGLGPALWSCVLATVLAAGLTGVLREPQHAA